MKARTAILHAGEGWLSLSSNGKEFCSDESKVLSSRRLTWVEAAKLVRLLLLCAWVE